MEVFEKDIREKDWIKTRLQATANPWQQKMGLFKKLL